MEELDQLEEEWPLPDWMREAEALERAIQDFYTALYFLSEEEGLATEKIKEYIELRPLLFDNEYLESEGAKDIPLKYDNSIRIISRTLEAAKMEPVEAVRFLNSKTAACGYGGQSRAGKGKAGHEGPLKAAIKRIAEKKPGILNEWRGFRTLLDIFRTDAEKGKNNLMVKLRNAGEIDIKIEEVDSTTRKVIYSRRDKPQSPHKSKSFDGLSNVLSEIRKQS